MKGRLPDIVLNQKKCGAQAADWYPRLTRERNHIAEEVKRLAENSEVASILDMERLKAILDSWPDRQPAEYTLEENHIVANSKRSRDGIFYREFDGSELHPGSDGERWLKRWPLC